MTREPVLLALLPAVLTEAGGTALLLANNHTTYGLLVAAATFLTGLGGVLARSRVSPV